MTERQLYRPCPMCRAQLKDVTEERHPGELYKGWIFFECPNCGSTVFINPFFRVKEGK